MPVVCVPFDVISVFPPYLFSPPLPPPQLTGLQVLHELDLDDAEDPRETVLYRLSLSPGLERFR